MTPPKDAMTPKQVHSWPKEAVQLVMSLEKKIKTLTEGKKLPTGKVEAWAIIYETGAVVFSGIPVVPYSENPECKIPYEVAHLIEDTKRLK